MPVRPLRTSEQVVHDLGERLRSLYTADEAANALSALRAQVDGYSAPRSTPYILSQQDALIIAYGDHVQSPPEAPLLTLHHVLKSLNVPVGGLHLLPFYPYSSDDGFSVIDYEAVDPALGSWEDIQGLGHDYRLMVDAVFNHISAQSEWFAAFRRGEPPYDRFFVTADPALDYSQVTRPRTLPLLTPVETASGTQYVWTTFSDDQVDLNFANPAVLVEVARILLDYVHHGASLIRLDAIAFLWKQVGSTCIHLPETHIVIKILRDVLDLTAPHVLLITETNVPHAENLSYFGNGVDEAQLVYQFPLPPLIAHSLLTGNAQHLTEWAASLEPLDFGNTFFNFTASHDGVGVRPVTGILSDEELAALVQATLDHGGQVSYRTLPDGSRSPYEMNITYFDLITAPEETRHAPEMAVRRFMTSQAIMMAMIGVPGIYFPSLFGGRNDYEGMARTGRARSINRRKFDEHALRAELSNPATTSAQVLKQYRNLLAVRAMESAFDPGGRQEVHRLDERVIALERVSSDGASRVLALHNVSDQPVTLDLSVPGDRKWHDLLGGESFESTIGLAPYQVAWLKARN
ncbi:MAG: alpha-amylase family glycosyl hydrolase [Anaerolineae bacterium]